MDKTNNFVWKATKADGTIPVQNISDQIKECEKKELKHFVGFEEMEAQSFVVSRINVDSELKEQEVVYCEQLERYVKVLKIEGKTCEVKDAEDGSQHSVAKDRLRKHVTLQIKVVEAGGKTEQDLTVLRIGVDDKLEKIFDVLALDSVSGSLVHNGAVVSADKLQQTLCKARIKADDKFALVVSEQGGLKLGEPLRWRRFKSNAAYNYIFNHRIDSIKFVPNIKIWFMGFG